MAGRPIIALVSLILLAAGVLFEFFIILSGVVSIKPFNLSYFMSASTSGIPSARLAAAGISGSPRVVWTYFDLAAQGTGATSPYTMHTAEKAAFPFNPQQNFGLSTSQLDVIPPGFRNTNYYYYLSRFAWVFYLIALFFAVIALFTGLLALCSRIGGYLSGFTASIATFFMALAASLMTAWTVQARHEWNSYMGGRANATLSKYGYGFTWAAFAAYFLSMILFCVSGAASGQKETTYKERKGLFGRKRSTRSKDGIRSEYS